jgi:hypothetical protein
MKSWEILVSKSKLNSWLVTTFTEKLICKKVKGKFYLKSNNNQLIDNHYIVEAVKL